MPQGGFHVDLLIGGVIRNTWVSRRKSFGEKFILNEAYFRGQRALLSGRMKVAEVHPGKYMMRQDKTIAIVLIALTVVSIGMRSSELGVIEVRVHKPDRSGSTHANNSPDPDKKTEWWFDLNGPTDSGVQRTR